LPTVVIIMIRSIITTIDHYVHSLLTTVYLARLILNGHGVYNSIIQAWTIGVYSPIKSCSQALKHSINLNQSLSN